MNIKHVFLVLGMQFLILNAQAQYNPFFQMYGGANEVAILSMDTVTDGGYILNAVDQNTGGSDFLIIKTDVNGNEEWRYHNNQFDGLDSSNVLYTITETLDRGFIAGGAIARDFSTGNYSDALVVKLDSLGNLKWKKSFNFSASEEVNSIHLKSDSTYILALRSIGNEKILNLDNNGDTLWLSEIPIHSGIIVQVKTAFQVDTNYYFFAQCDSILISFGYTKIIKTNATGNLIWMKDCYDTSSVIGSSFWYTKDSVFLINNYMRSPNSNYYSRQFKISLQGNLLDTIYPPVYGFYDSDSTVLYVNSGLVNNDSLYIGRAYYTTGQIRNFASLYVPNNAINDIVSDRQTSILTCGSQDIFGKLGILIKAVDTLNVKTQDISNDKIATVNVFPNPTNDWVHISVSGINDYNIGLFNNLGEEVISYENLRVSFFSFKVNDLPKGFYYYNMSSGRQKIIAGKIVIN